MQEQPPCTSSTDRDAISGLDASHIRFGAAGFSAGDEINISKIYLTSSNPVTAESSTPVSIGDIAIQVLGTDIVINWDGTSGSSYALQRKLDLVSDSWITIVQGVSGTGALSATNAIAGESAAFYRIVVE